jgi:hypothetical protein
VPTNDAATATSYRSLLTMDGGPTITTDATTGAGTERKTEVSGGLSLYIPVPGLPIGGYAIDDDTRARIARGARVSTISRKRRGGAGILRHVPNDWIW